MTDEERAREIVQRHGRILPPERQMELGLAIWDAIQVSRADQREKCAQVADQEAARQYAVGTQGAALASERIAAAIRAMGDKP